jgi:hypothetical protein
VRKPEGREHLEDQDVCGWIVSKIDLVGIGWNGMEWIDVAQERDRWSVLVNTVMSLWVHNHLCCAV